MKRHLERAAAWIDERSLRERAMVLVAILAVLFSAWSALLMDPLHRERADLVARLDETATRLGVLERQTRDLGQRLAEGPEAEKRRRLERLEREIAELDERLEAHRVGLVSAAQMARVLEDLLGRDGELRLLRLESFPPVPVVDETPLAEGESAALFQHDVEIELEGSYFAALRYVRAIEALPWRIYRDELHLEVTEHPTARITLRFHTLSFEEAWVGV